MNKVFVSILKKIIREIFAVSLVTYLIFYLVESLAVGSVSNFLNMNYILVLVIISGVITVLFHKEDEVQPTTKTNLKSNLIFIVLLGLIATGLIFFKTKELGWISYVISVLSGLIIVLLSFLMLTDEEKIDEQ